ncbi:carboxypeptidase-like regulatory domain-containing protein [Aureibacter tunicatorum]|uniref:Carboxypeptidase-like regulatory domain-containing protein n=1 Tax=Aureibacter tunicatorum TaxID=866807 RepID=A0AAE4BV35_9BACT|nr:carboxypeptidase-like regulatory domain-containing protein [Aureibacter tunicatorum]MDR6241467.1 hypothetical protein [Aureibacter tunicatorum]
MHLLFVTHAQNKLEISGKIFDEEGEELFGANVFPNSSPFAGVSSDVNGDFLLLIESSDTINFTSMGFATVKIWADDDKEDLKIVMKPSSTMLREVVVIGIPEDAEDFKKEVLRYRPPEEEEFSFKIDPEVLDKLPSEVAQQRQLAESQLRIRMPVSMKINFTKRFYKDKEKEKFKKIKQNESKWNRVELYYNIETVKQMTAIESDSLAKEFLKFCYLDEKFLLESNAYDVQVKLLECYEEFALINRK